MKRELCDDLAGVMAERDRLLDELDRLRIVKAVWAARRADAAGLAPPLGYRWQIRAEYTNGMSLSWPFDDEAAARAEYDLILAEQAAGAHEDLAGLAIERRPVRPWEPVCSMRFDATAGEGDR